MACMAPSLPSQRRAGGNSERHQALQRMRERRAVRASTPEADDEPWPAPRKKGGYGVTTIGSSGDSRSLPPLLRDSSGDRGQRSPRTPRSPRPPRPSNDEDPPPRPVVSGARPPAGEPPRRLGFSRSSGSTRQLAGPPSPTGGCETPRGARPPRPSAGCQEDSPRGSRRRFRDRATREEEDEIPAQARGADFKMLQDMIARGIQDAESGATQLEANLRDDEAELRRRRESQQHRREEEAARKQKEREKARECRRKEQQDRERRQALELQRQEEEERHVHEEQEAIRAQCARELRAVVRIQARCRGRRSRRGLVTPWPPAAVAKQHADPWANSGRQASSAELLG
eukprot:CAMPEP_0172678462 /NCGR_PEP_ID=MMETSP1074-20121228/15425_1 /TAXON_ID=2916 /ORGANISM="Ceratium fusus, Strain PA161109" /LENGTH=342 /DNA_ID=CAMNT_0013496513 /DNA_START=45 /DNA_END=1073 /DNA_ORIENTATION=-